jgi:ankyrin repeat domain-containing protein 50
MALAFANAGKLKPELELAKAISEYEAILSDEDKAKLRTSKAGPPPDAIDVMRLTAEINKASRSGRCVGTRFTNVLNSIQLFAALGDIIIGGSQNLIACGVWALVRMTLQMAGGSIAFFEKLSELFMNIGRSAPRYKEMCLLYPRSRTLRRDLCEYFTVMVRLFTKVVKFCQKSTVALLSATAFMSFDSQFGSVLTKLDGLANSIKEEVTLLSKRRQEDEAQENSRFRALVSSTSKGVEQRRKLKAKLRLLDRCSEYDHETSWKQARKQGKSSWLCETPEYRAWREQLISTSLLLSGKLGSGKTVLTASIVENLTLWAPKGTVAYFFCRHDVLESLKARTIIGSIARQLLEKADPDILDIDTHSNLGAGDILQLLRASLPRTPHFVVVDGLDECSESEKMAFIEYLRQLLDKHVILLFLSGRSEVESALSIPSKRLPVFATLGMPERNQDIVDYIHEELYRRLGSEKLCIRDPAIVVDIQKALENGAQGMFLWVALQIDSICEEETDDDILKALENLPTDLPQTYDRILQKGARSGYQRIILELVTAAHRPLALCELRDAVSVTPGDEVMNPAKFVNNIRKTLTCCGSLLAIDEEELTVVFAHHSIKQHLLSPSQNSKPAVINFTKEEADIAMGSISVTYLNWSIFESQLTRSKFRSLNAADVPSNILNAALPPSNVGNKIAQKYLRAIRNQSSFNFGLALMDEMECYKARSSHSAGFDFHTYAKAYWIYHTKKFNNTMGRVYLLWRRLLRGTVQAVGLLPWQLEVEFGSENLTMSKSLERDSAAIDRFKWALQHRHPALIELAREEDIGRLKYEVSIWLYRETGRMLDLAISCRNEGRLKDAEELGLHAIEMRKTVLGEEHQDSIKSVNELALTYRHQGRSKEAKVLFTQVADMRTRILGGTHPDTLSSFVNLALSSLDDGQPKDADKLLKRITRVLADLANFALTNWRQGEAKKLLVQVIDMLVNMTSLSLTYWHEKQREEIRIILTQVGEGLGQIDHLIPADSWTVFLEQKGIEGQIPPVVYSLTYMASLSLIHWSEEPREDRRQRLIVDVANTVICLTSLLLSVHETDGEREDALRLAMEIAYALVSVLHFSITCYGGEQVQQKLQNQVFTSLFQVDDALTTMASMPLIFDDRERLERFDQLVACIGEMVDEIARDHQYGDGTEMADLGSSLSRVMRARSSGKAGFSRPIPEIRIQYPE